MATRIIIKNQEHERRAAREDVRKLKNIDEELTAALRDWETLTAAQRNAALKTVTRAVRVLVRQQIVELKA